MYSSNIYMGPLFEWRIEITNVSKKKHVIFFIKKVTKIPDNFASTYRHTLGDLIFGNLFLYQ